MSHLEVDITLSQPFNLNVCLQGEAGELLAVVGQSGAGKSSLLRVLAGLHRPAQGLIKVGGETWLDSTQGVFKQPHHRRVGKVFQDYALMPHLDAMDNVGLALLHLPRAQRQRQAMAWLEKVGLTSKEALRRPQNLSGGQQQRVALARALAREPALLLLDEPFSAVDQLSRQELYSVLADLRAQLNVPIVFVTHDLNEARLLSDRMIVIDQGEVLQVGASSNVYRRPRNSRVADLLGIRNRFHGVWQGAEVQAQNNTGKGWGRLHWLPGAVADGKAQGINLKAPDKGKIRPGSEVNWIIHSDGMSVYEGEPLDAAHAVLESKVIRARDLGEQTLLDLAVCDNESLLFSMNLIGPYRLQVQPSQVLQVKLDLRYIHIMPKRENPPQG